MKDSLLQGIFSALAPDSGLLVPTERHIWVERVHAIDPGRTGLQFVRDPNPARDVLGEYRGGKAVQGVIRLTDDILLIVKLDDHANWPENLLLDNAHVRPCVGEDGWLDPVALCAVLLASKVHLCALLLARVDVIHDALPKLPSE